MTLRKNEYLAIYGLLISVSIVLSWNYLSFIEIPNFHGRLDLHNEILLGNADSPYRYRILVPYTIQCLIDFGSLLGFEVKTLFYLFYFILNFISVSGFLISLYIFSQIWHDKLYSVLGVLFISSLMPIAFRDHGYQPWSIVEAFLFTSALIFMHFKKFSIVIFLTVLCSLNRETGIFISIMFALVNIKLRVRKVSEVINDMRLIRVLLQSLLLFILSVSILFMLRVFQGQTKHIHTLLEIFKMNTTSIAIIIQSIVHVILFAGILWYFSFKSIKFLPDNLKNLILFIPIYVIPVLLFGVWREVRLLLPIYPILLVSSLFYIKYLINERYNY